MKYFGLSRRLVRAIALALALGFITNALVCVWCVYGARADTSARPVARWNRGDQWFWIRGVRVPGKEVFEWSRAEPLDPMERPARVPALGVDPYAPWPPRWSTIYTQALPIPRDLGRRFDVAYGWPMLSFRGGVTDRALAPFDRRHDYGAAFPDLPAGPSNGLMKAFTTNGEPRTLPLMPIAAGMVANTALYGGAWWALLFTPGAVQRSRRRRRGRCIGCGYDRRGLGADAACPECGQ